MSDLFLRATVRMLWGSFWPYSSCGGGGGVLRLLILGGRVPSLVDGAARSLVFSLYYGRAGCSDVTSASLSSLYRV